MRALPTKSLLLLVILSSAFLFRLNGFSHPIADWHSWRQADTSAVSRNFIKMGYDLLHPRFDDLSNVPSGYDNPNGYRFVEFPIYNFLQAGTTQFIGILTLEEWGRLITILTSLGSILFIYFIVKRYAGERAGLLSAAFYAFVPYNIFYGRVILPDPSMVAFSLGAVYFFIRWTEKNQKSKIKNQNWIWYILSLVFSALALLLKPYAVFFLLPIGYIAFEKYKLSIITQWKLWLFAIIAILPLVLWRYWMNQYPEGIPANTWLLNGNGIRFRPAFFRWIVYERLTRLILGYAGIIFLALGVYNIVISKKLWFFSSFILGSLLYICIFATGNVQHDYYQILVMPTIAMTAGLGAEWIVVWFEKKYSQAIIGVFFVLFIFFLSFYFSWQQVKGYFYINNRAMIIAGEEVDRLTPKDAKVIALYDGDTSFLYQTNRQGWASLASPLEELIAKGADYMVFANPTFENLSFGAPYKILAQGKEFIIYDLHEKR